MSQGECSKPEKAMIETHVNLCHLFDTTRLRTKVQAFPSEARLRKYTLSTKKIFRREEAYEGGLLKYLLRQIKVPIRGTGWRAEAAAGTSKIPSRKLELKMEWCHMSESKEQIGVDEAGLILMIKLDTLN